MTDRAFVDFLAAMWAERGWETGVAEEEAGVFMITGDRSTGQRGLMLVVPGTGAVVPGKRAQTVASICDAKNVDVGVVATRGTFSDDAQRIAEVNDVHLLDGEALEETVESEGMHDLVESFVDNPAGGSSLRDRLPLPDELPSLRSPSPIQIPTRGLMALLGLVAVIAIGVVGAQTVGVVPDLGTLPVLGGAGGSGFTMTAASLSSGTGGGGLDVAWHARPQKKVVTDAGRFEPDPGSRFVVVQMNVTNRGDSQMVVTPRFFGLAANNSRVGPQLLNGAKGQPPMPVPPGGERSVWVAFPVDEGVDEGTLLGLPGERVPPIRFHRDRSLSFAVKRG
ncbi:MAG: restriction endonuclease [Halanaeroarchaeum sp.]